MPTTFAAARDFARPTSGGSRIAQSLYQSADDLSPSYFRAGEVSPGAALVKFAQLYLTRSARQRRLAAGDQAMAEAQQAQKLTLDKLTRESDPNYVTPYQQQELTLQRDKMNADKRPTPRAPIALTQDFGPWKAGTQVDPDEYNRVASDLREREVQGAIGARQRKAAEQRQQQRSQLGNAKAGLRELEAGGVRAQDAAEAQARSQYDTLISDASRNDGSLASQSARTFLKLPAGAKLDPMTDTQWIEKNRADYIATARKNAAGQYEKTASGKRSVYQRMIDENTPAAGDDAEFNDFESALRDGAAQAFSQQPK